MKLMQGTIVLLLLGVAHSAAAAEFKYQLKATAAGVADGGRDLGLLNHSEHQQGYFDFSPWIHLQAGSWGFFFRPEFYAQTGPLLRPGNEANNAREDVGEDYYAAVKEAWIEFGGLTSYPGEWIRAGRQRIRYEDAQWWDVDIDAARWVFDTSQFQMDFGGARQFNSYRSDDVEVSDEQRDRTYAFGSIGGEPVARHRLTLRATFAKDDNDPLPPPGATPQPDEKLFRSETTWVGLLSHNHYFDWRRPPHVGYYFTGIGQFGKTRFATLADPIDAPPGTLPTVATIERDTVRGYAAEAMGKLAMPRRWPIQLGGGYTYSSGGSATDRTEQFFQTGVHSNYSRFTGTRSLIYRYNEAYRAELGNLQVLTAFAAIDVGHYDASFVYEEFLRTRRHAPVFTEGVIAQPIPGGARRLGRGADLVLSRYFTIDPERLDDPEGQATSSVVRLKGSVFEPGPAYADGAHEEYRVMVEVTLWYGSK